MPAGSRRDPPVLTRSRQLLWLSLAIVIATLAAYYRVFSFGFIGIDDPAYVSENPYLQEPDLASNLRWIVLSFHPDNWFPLTRLSLYVDYHVFGLNPLAFHLENLAMHCAASVLLLLLLNRTTSQLWPSAFVAAVFALHPLHVESVAWIAERKDVLCALLWFATLWAWAADRYWTALVLFLLGLMAKPMIVTLPVLLVIFDYWPLGHRPALRRTLGKLPFLAASLSVMALTVFAQRGAGALQSFNMFPFPLRIQNALVTVPKYLADTFWPATLWAMHSYPLRLPWAPSLWAAAGILALSALAVLQLRARPWFAAAWFWFLLTLAPVIGIVQVGPQSRADRYMYVPMVGIAIIVAWAGAEAARRWPRLVAGVALAVCLAMAVKTSFQTRYWSDSATLFRHSVQADPEDYEAWNYLGQSSAQPPVAMAAYRKGLELRPDHSAIRHNLATALCEIGRMEECLGEYRAAILLDPTWAPSHAGIANIMITRGQTEEAIREFREALRLDPRFAATYTDLGALLWKDPARRTEAFTYLEKAVALDRFDPLAHRALGEALEALGRKPEAERHFREARRLDPSAEPRRLLEP